MLRDNKEESTQSLANCPSMIEVYGEDEDQPDMPKTSEEAMSILQKRWNKIGK